jgi:4-carboxymuconolactone decarboxylase
MSRIPYVEAEAAPEPVREALEALPPLNIFKLMANAETCFRPALRLGGAILGRQDLDPVLRELAILRVARLSPAEYEWVQHADIHLTVGGTQAHLDALLADDIESDAFTPEQRAVLTFTTEVVRDATVSPSTFEAVAASHPPREIMELTLAISYYMLIARVMNVSDIDMDPSMGNQVIGAQRKAPPAPPRP